MAFATTEVRWFFDGALEETGRGVAGWFESGAQAGRRAPAWDPASPAWRQDRYLLIPGGDDMGIKWRDRRLEVKGRAADLGVRAFAPEIEGRCERWIKWSYAGDRVAARFLRLFQDEGVAIGGVLVEKRRQQRLLRVDDRGATTDVARDQPRERGVNVELARIRLPELGEEHWSLAFEAFPADDRMTETLAPIVARVLEHCPVLPFGANRSMAYPRWLLGIEGRIDTAA